MTLEVLKFPVGHKNLDEFMELTHARFSDIRVVRKSSSFFMYLIYYVSLMFIWQKRFMKGYNTTIGQTVYVIDRTIDEKRWEGLYRTMRHEFIHMLQDEKEGIWFKLGYLFPQVLGLFSIFALLAIWFSNFWLLSLVFLGALAPWPAPFRAMWELEGYTQSLLAEFEATNRIRQDRVDWVVKQFVTSAYYFMSWSRAGVEAEVKSIINGIRSGRVSGKFLHYK